MNNVLVVYNPSAGRKKAITYKRKVQTFLLKYTRHFKFITTNKLETYNTEAFDTIIVIGGDGTLNKVLPYLKDKTLGIIPCGTANLVAESLGINNLTQALHIIEQQYFTFLDVMRINEKYCILRCGLGYDADIISKTPQSLKNKFGYFAYFIAGILFALRLKIKEYNILIENEPKKVKASCIIVANIANMYKNYFTIEKNTCLNDGFFDIFILKTQNPILLFVEFLSIIFNFKTSNSRAEYIKTNKLVIQNRYALAHIDGEKSKFTENLHFSIEKRFINIYCKEDICLGKREILTEDMQKTMV